MKTSEIPARIGALNEQLESLHDLELKIRAVNLHIADIRKLGITFLVKYDTGFYTAEVNTPLGEITLEVLPPQVKKETDPYD